MAKKRTTTEKATIIKIAEKVGELAGKIVNKKEQLVEMAGNAFNSVKATVIDITERKKAVPRKAAKPAVKKKAKKLAQPAAKKAGKTPAKKTGTIKKTIPKAAKTVTKKAGGKKSQD